MRDRHILTWEWFNVNTVSTLILSIIFEEVDEEESIHQVFQPQVCVHLRDFFVSQSFYKTYLSRRQIYFIFQDSAVPGITAFNKTFCISSYCAFVPYNCHNKPRQFVCIALPIHNGDTVCSL